MRPSGGGDLAFNLGPLDSERGPVIFENTDIFPNLVESLLREPSGLLFKVANYDVVDEKGRNFAFSSAVTNQRTVGITIDYGEGTVETYRVATHSKFDARGRPLGISLERALQIVGLSHQTDEQPLPATPTAAQQSSYGTLRDTTGVERLVRVRGIQNDLSGNPVPQKRFWAILTNNASVAADSDFSSLRVNAGDEYLLYFTRDIDRDGLHEREELLYGSLDSTADSDGDGLSDYDEVRTGWTVMPLPGPAYRVFPSPARHDSDLDGMSDGEEKHQGSDPNRADTDMDGLTDTEELRDTPLIAVFDGDANDSNNTYLHPEPYSDATVIDGGDGRCATTAQGDDVQLVALGAEVRPGDVVIAAGPNGTIESKPGGDDMVALTEKIAAGADGTCDTTATGDDIQLVAPGQPASAAPAEHSNAACVGAGLNGAIDSLPADDDFVRVVHESLFSTHPVRQDTDFDGIPDGRELLIGTNPNARDEASITDTDGDGLYDAQEDKGWIVAATGDRKTSNKRFADTDQDGVLDVFEWAIASDPQNVDSDGDGLLDAEELDPEDTGYYSVANLAVATRRCANARSCVPVTPPALSGRLRTNVVETDSDHDGLDDLFEVNGNKPGSAAWTVNVAGQPSRAARPLPWVSDADLDGLKDGQEYDARTDPNDDDTDNDAKPGLDGRDRYEIIQGRNPLLPDERVTVDYVELLVKNACESPEPTGEFWGNLYVTGPNGTQTLVWAAQEMAARAGDSPDISESNASALSFLLSEGQSFTLSSDGWYEDDPGGNDVAGQFSRTFNYFVAGVQNETASFEGADSDCGGDALSVKYSIWVR